MGDKNHSKLRFKHIVISMVFAAHLVFLGACYNLPACDERMRTLDSPATAGTLGFSLDTALAGRRS